MNTAVAAATGAEAALGPVDGLGSGIRSALFASVIEAYCTIASPKRRLTSIARSVLAGRCCIMYSALRYRLAAFETELSTDAPFPTTRRGDATDRCWEVPILTVLGTSVQDHTFGQCLHRQYALGINRVGE